jgi:hypothetical protein
LIQKKIQKIPKNTKAVKFIFCLRIGLLNKMAANS